MYIKLDNGEILAKEINSYEDINDELVGHPDSIYNSVEQIGRLEWLITRNMEKPIMEVGTACGYVLNRLNGDIGIDIRSDRLLVAKLKYPNMKFYYGNCFNLAPFYNMNIKSIILAELLEHLPYELAFHAIIHCLKTSNKIYYTLPNSEKDINVAKNSEHKWYPTKENTKILMDNVNRHLNIIYNIEDVYGFLCGTITKL